MSRVFDALNRASEEKKAPVQKTKALGVLSRKESTHGSSGSNGNSASESLSHSGNHHAQISWRERLETICFGWNTSRLQTHPLVAVEKDLPAAEQYKILREQLKKIRGDTGARCLTVTSPLQRDGKTTVAVNLAAAMALDYDAKILLIDGDLRRPEVHRYFGIHPSPGLGDYLSSGANGNLMSCIRETSIPGLHVIPGGKPTTISSELLAQHKMTTLMQEIRVSFPEHQIILDAPPVLLTPDALVLGKHVDGIIMVVRAGKTPRDSLVKAVQSLNSAKILGIVMNGIDLRPSSAYNYYSYSAKNR